MSDWSGQDYLNELGGRPAARMPASIGEVWNAEWQRAGLDTIGGVGRPYAEALADLERAIGEAAGRDVADYAFEQGVTLARAASPDERVRMLGELIQTLPEDKRKTVEPLRDVRRRAAEKAQKIEADANDVAGATYGLSGTATAWAAGIARLTVDPVNLGAMALTAPIGGPLAGNAARVVARQAAAGAAAQALVEPVIEPARAELGLDHGLDRALGNIAGAAVGGAAVAGGILGLGALFRTAARRMRGEAPRAAADAGVSAESDVEPFLTADDIEALYRGGPDTTNRAPGLGAAAADAPDVVRGSFDIAEGARAQPTRDRAPVAPPPDPSDVFTGYLRSEDADALFRGGPDATNRTPGLAAAASDAPDSFGTNLDFEGGARAAPTRTRAPAAALPDPVGEFRGYLAEGDAAAFDRGGPIVDAPGRAFHGSDAEGLGGFNLSADDLRAAARLSDRNQLFEAAALAGGESRFVDTPRIDAAARAIEDGEPIIDIVMQPKRRAAVTYRAQSLIEFLAARGGIAADDPLAPDVMQSFGGQNPFIPGYGRLFRKAGAPLDRQLQAAIEARYLHDPAIEAGNVSDFTIRELIEAIDNEARGNRLYPAGEEGTLTRAQMAAFRESDRAAREAARADIAERFDARMAEVQITKPLKAVSTRAQQILENEDIDPLLAYERALLEYEDKQDALRQARHAEPELEIPGWDVPDDAGAASPVGGDAARAEGSAGGGNAGAAARADGGRARSGEPAGLGADPVLKAEADRVLAARGDIEITLPDGNGGFRKAKASEFLAEIADDAKAADEFLDCVGGSGGGE